MIGLTGEIEKGSPVQTLHFTKAVFGRVQGFEKRRAQDGGRIAIVWGRTQPGASLTKFRASENNLALVTEDDLAEEDRLLSEGWGWPEGAQSAHYFFDGRSLCAIWGWLPLERLEAIGEKSPDDCQPCTRLLHRRLREAQTRALEAQDAPEAARLERLIRTYDELTPPILKRRAIERK